jgi:biopolymer transport protein ExbB/TolQ
MMVWIAELHPLGAGVPGLAVGMPGFLGDGFRFALEESTPSGLAICAALFVLSCFSWAVMLSKASVLAKVKRRSRRFLREFRQSSSPLEVFARGGEFPASPVYAVYLAGCRELAVHLVGTAEGGKRFARRLEAAPPVSPAQMEGIDGAMSRAAGDSVLRLEASMTLLATAVSGAPFLGLLGTVWGVMDTFGGVAVAEGATSLKSMAPGVSAALVTTVVGLLVAIPAMFGYNFLVNSIRRTTAELDHFATELSTRFRRRYVAFPGQVGVTASAAAGAEAFGAHQEEAPSGWADGEQGCNPDLPGLDPPPAHA